MNKIHVIPLILLESDNRADSANKATFTDYAIPVRHRAGYDGIGIGIFGDSCAIKIDNCVEYGVLSEMAEDIIARMDTYTEYRLSGAGVRILFKVSLPAYDKDRYYINNRRINGMCAVVRDPCDVAIGRCRLADVFGGDVCRC